MFRAVHGEDDKKHPLNPNDEIPLKENFDKIDDTRYESYKIFVEEAKNYKEKVKFQGVKKETTHKSTHDKISVKISARKRQSARNTLKQNIYKDIEDEKFD